MRKFSIKLRPNNDVEKYIIFYEDQSHFSAGHMCQYHLTNWYGMKKRKITFFLTKYNGNIYNGSYSVDFSHEADAQKFMDEFLVPYEIAFNLK